MGRIYDELKVNRSKFLALFDSGSLRSYITERAAKKAKLPIIHYKRSYTTALGGRKWNIKEFCPLEGILQGFPFEIEAFLIDRLGETEQGELDILFGALDMQKWNIKLDLKREHLNLSHFRKEFIEF